MTQVTWRLTLLLPPQVCLFTDSRKDQLRYHRHICAILTAKSRSWAKRKIKNSFLLENWIRLSSQFCKLFLLRMKRSGLGIADRSMVVLVERVMESEVESRFLCQAESGSSQKSRRDIHIRAGKKQSKLLSLETGILGEELTSSNLNSMTLSSVSFYDLTWSGDVFTIYSVVSIEKYFKNFKQPAGKQTFGKQLVHKMRYEVLW